MVLSFNRVFLLPLDLSDRRGVVVACVCTSVCPSVRPSVRKLYLVRAITRHRFELESPNLHQTCILGYSRLVLKMVIDLDLQGHFGHFDSEFEEIRLVRTITRHRCGLKSPNLPQTCILGYSRLVLKMEVIDLRITKFAPNMHPMILSAGIENGGH